MRPHNHSVATFVFVVLAAVSAHGHDLEITAGIVGNEIQGKVYFPTGESANYTDVELLDHDGNVLSTTKTDDHGRFNIATPGEYPVTVASETEDGHRDEITIKSRDHVAAPHVEAEPPHAHSDGLSEDHVRTIVQEELRPLREQLAEQSSRTRARDIFGGIGYIVGVFGLIVLLKRNPVKRG